MSIESIGEVTNIEVNIFSTSIEQVSHVLGSDQDFAFTLSNDIEFQIFCEIEGESFNKFSFFCSPKVY